MTQVFGISRRFGQAKKPCPFLKMHHLPVCAPLVVFTKIGVMEMFITQEALHFHTFAWLLSLFIDSSFIIQILLYI